MKRICAMILSVLLLFSAGAVFSACDGNGADGDAVTLTVYRARANNHTVGDDDDVVEAAIEEAFYADTGIKIDLVMRMYENDQLPDIVTTDIVSSRADVDAVMHTISADLSGSAIMNYAMDSYGTTIDVESLLQQYGQNILAKIEEGDEDNKGMRAAYLPIASGDSYEYQMKIIPAVYQQDDFAIMLRKDYWEEAYSAGYTQFNPEDYDIYTNADGYKHLKISEFTQLMTEINTWDNALNGNAITYPVAGKYWDIARVVGSAFGADSFNNGMYNESVVPNYFTDEWADFVGLLYDWSSSGVWERDSAQVNDDTRTNNFLAGNHVAYMCYPTSEQLINISRRMSTADSSSSCMIIAPFADEDGTVRGYYSQPRSFEGIIIPAKSTDAQVLVQFIDWMYSDVEHYELAKYGIKGTHWVEGEDVTIGGETYKTWEYPANKAAQYNERPPYSGCWEILINLNVSNRIRGDWSPKEQAWYVYITQQAETISNELEGINMPEVPRAYTASTTAMSNYYTDNIIGNAIAGRQSNGQDPDDALREYRSTALSSYADYFTWLNARYDDAETFFASKFAE